MHSEIFMYFAFLLLNCASNLSKLKTKKKHLDYNKKKNCVYGIE